MEKKLITSLTLSRRYKKLAKKSQKILLEMGCISIEDGKMYQLKELPEYFEIHDKVSVQHKTTVKSIVEDAVSIVNELAEELDEWANNMPESLHGGQKYEDIQTAVSALQEIDGSIDLDGDNGDIELFFIPSDDLTSRSKRRDEAVAMLEAAQTALQEVEAELPDDETDDLSDLCDQLQEMIDELGNVEFPSMFG